MQNRSITIVSNTNLTITLTLIAVSVLFLLLIRKALGSLYIFDDFVGIFANTLLVYFLISNIKAMEHLKRRLTAWKEQNFSSLQSRKVEPVVVEVDMIPVAFQRDMVVIDLE